MFKSDVTGRGKKKKQRVLVGRVLSFMLMSGGKNEMKQIIYKWDGEKNVGAQCDWYCFDHVNQQLTGKRLIEQPMFAHGYHCCSNYICSLPPPVINNESQLLFSSDITVMEMKNLIKGFCL